MLWINISRTNNMMLLKLIGTENTVKIAPFFCFVFVFFGGEPNVWQKKNEKNDFKKKSNMFGASIPLTRLYFWTQ